MGISTSAKGIAKGTFKGDSGAYDIVLGFYDIHSEGSSSITVRIGDQTIPFSMLTEGNDLICATIPERVYVAKGSTIELIGLASELEFTSVYYLDFIPSESLAFRPYGAERAYVYQSIFRAIDYDDRNIHLTALKFPIFKAFLSWIFLSFVNWTPGMFITGLRVVGLNTPSFRVASLRLLGNLLSLWCLGVGTLCMFFAKYRQSWGDILSATFIVTLSMERPGVFAHNTKNGVFGTNLENIGGFQGVPGEFKIASLGVDASILVAFGLGKLLIHPLFSTDRKKDQQIRLEFEEMNIGANTVERSLVPMEKQ